jgi:hypothetical protein
MANQPTVRDVTYDLLRSIGKLAHEVTAAVSADGPTVIVVPTRPQPAHLS